MWAAFSSQEAILSTEIATGCSAEQALLEEATEALVRAGDERLSRVVLTWKYGAMAVAVAGDIVGGWQNHVSLVRCTNPTGCKGDTVRGEARDIGGRRRGGEEERGDM